MNRQETVLVVDDSKLNRDLLIDMLDGEYEVLEACDGLEAIGLIVDWREKISLILLDIVMPRMDGFEVLSIMKDNRLIERIPVILISSQTESSFINQGFDLGVTDYITRPFDVHTVRRRIRNTILLYKRQSLLEAKVAEEIAEKEHSVYLMVELLANVVEFRNRDSGPHVFHIRALTDIILRKLVTLTDRYPLPAERIELIVNASALHDVGKICIKEGILDKPGRLTEEEFAVVKTHCMLGASIIEEVLQRHREELVQVIYNICRWHHERWDGKGYPDGLKGDDIPIEAQVVALADVYDALTSERVYKKPIPHSAALAMILRGECGAFNPVLLQCLRELGPCIPAELARRFEAGAEMAELKGRCREMIYEPGRPSVGHALSKEGRQV